MPCLWIRRSLSGKAFGKSLLPCGRPCFCVILVVFIFLQSLPGHFDSHLTVPVASPRRVSFFPVLGFSINSLSLFGLVLAIGLVVDDAIVVVEAVEIHIARGLSPREASLKAMEEVSGPVIAVALILAAVFVPTAFHSWNHWSPLSAICRYHCYLGPHFGFQRALVEPGVVLCTAEAEPRDWHRMDASRLRGF